MKCDKILETMPDLAAGMVAATPDVSEHLRSCAACATKLDEMRKTMALLDEWQVPEPSPYFDVRLQARLREETAKPATGWLQWFRRPALALSLTILIAVGVMLVSRKTGVVPSNGANEVAQAQDATQPGTAVGDLQALDNNDELYANFDVLDDLQVQQDVTANP
jgi:anti-sigma factor RsiW